jgi:hypothetical protein
VDSFWLHPERGISRIEIVVPSFTFLVLLLFLQVVYIPPDVLLVEPIRVHNVTSRPKVIAPVWLLFQTRIALE